MARVVGNLQRGTAAARDFTKDPVQAPDQSQVDPRVAQARQRAGIGQGSFAPTLAAAAGAGFVFGPVGALLAGWAVNHSARKNKERLVAAAGALAANKTETLDKARASLQGALDAATNDADRAEIKADLDAFDSYATAAFSPDPSIATTNFNNALGVSGALQDLLDDQQGELLEREKVERERIARDENQTVTLRNKLVAESQPFIQSQRAFQTIDDITSRDPTQIDSQVLVNQLARLSNPGEIITEGDIQVLSTGGGLPDQLVNRLNSILLGTSRLTPGVVAEVRETAKSLMRTQVAEQVDRNQSFANLARDLELPTDLASNITVPIRVDRARLPASKIAESLYTPSGVDPTDTPAEQFVDRFIVDPLSEAFIPEGGLQPPTLDTAREFMADPPWLLKQVMPWYMRQGVPEASPRPTNGDQADQGGIYDRFVDWYEGSGREERRRRQQGENQ
jgi:hypothetical protein